MAAHARPTLLLSALTLLLAALLHAAAAATSCAPRACGNLTIAYPFWLPDQPAGSSAAASPAPCGPAAFQVDCRGGQASLANSFRGAYKILRVSYGNRTLVVANDNVQTNASGCPVPRIDVSASLSLAPFTASAANAQLVFLFTSNCTAATKHRSPRIVHKSPAQNESGGSESIESNTQLTLSEEPIEFQVDLHSARLASSLRRLTGAEAEAAPTRNGRRNQSHHRRRAAPLQQTLRLSARYGRIGQAKEEDEATNDGEPAINMQETEGRGTGGGV